VDYNQPEAEALFSSIFQSVLGSELSYQLDQATEVTDAIWELAPVVVAAGEQHDRQSPAEAANRSAAGLRLAAGERDVVRAVADAILEMSEASARVQETDQFVLSGLTARDAVADPFGVIARLTTASEQTALVMSMMEQVAALSVDEMLYLRDYIRAWRKSERTPMLLRALFVTTVGMVEPLVSRLASLLLYQGSPGRYPSLAAEVLEAETRRLCFGPPDKWRRSLVDDLGVTELADAVSWERLAALWEDRNVIAHRGSVTDMRHSARTGMEVGSLLSPDADAVRAAADVIGATRCALITCVWAHLEPRQSDVAAQMTGALLWESLRAGRWRQAELLGLAGRVLAEDPQRKASAQVERWLAIEMGHGTEAIRAEVEEWDITDLSPIYAVARHILLRKDDEALAMLPGVIDIDTWPLFDRLRSEGKLATFPAS
jgi:hypothetical protein